MVSALPPVKLGINPIGWSNDDLRTLGRDIPLAQCLREARAAGFDGVELGHKFPRDPGALRAVLAEHDLSCVSGWYSSDLLVRTVDEEKAALADHLALLVAQGCSVLVWCDTGGAVHGDLDTPLSGRPVLDDAQWKKLCRGLDEMAAHVAEHGLALCYHHHMGCSVQTAADIARLMDGTADAVRLLVDTGHATFAGADPIALVRTYGPRVGHVHCKDVRPAVLDAARQNDASFLQVVLAGAFTVPGDGAIDYAAVLGALADVDYAGPWLVVEAEQDPQRHPPAKMADIGHSTLSRLLEG